MAAGVTQMEFDEISDIVRLWGDGPGLSEVLPRSSAETGAKDWDAPQHTHRGRSGPAFSC